MNKLLILYCSIQILFLSGIKLNAQVYQLSDQVFIDYLKTQDPNLIINDNQLILSQVPSSGIETISLSNVGLENIDGVQFFSNVREINVSSNNISEVPDLNALTQLKVLNLSRNQIDSFNSVSMLKALETLDLSYNQISNFPDFHPDVALKNLYLSNNDIEEVVNFQKANNLETLDLSNNSMVNLQPFNMTEFPVLSQVDIEFNYLYFDDYENLPSVTINKENQKIITLNSPDTLYIGDTLKLDVSFDLHPSNFHVLIKKPTFFELADSYDPELKWAITDTSQSGTYYVETVNSTFTSNFFATNDFSFVVLEERLEQPKDTLVQIENEYQKEIIPDGTLEEQSIYIDGEGEATIFNKSGDIYKRLTLPFEWNGSNNYGAIIPGYYLIKVNEDKYIKITIVY